MKESTKYQVKGVWNDGYTYISRQVFDRKYEAEIYGHNYQLSGYWPNYTVISVKAKWMSVK